MSTRSAIITKTDDGLYTGIYCHYDGYPSGVGHTLLTYYTHRSTVLDLIALKDISVLGIRVSPLNPESHSFTNPEEGTTIAYERDRGESIEVVKDPSYKALAAKFRDHYDSEYIYLFEDNVWRCNNSILVYDKKT
jgi:hypothetical protein